jgi:hypothetical protein
MTLEMSRIRCLRALAALTSLVLFAGCSSTPVRPWQKDLLAKPGMAMDGDALEQRFHLHIYASKENASGGQGVGGGGCGCN